jgi:peptidoglycan/xylan/chitin deacetylase (PgdA/CDA1 family)
LVYHNISSTYPPYLDLSQSPQLFVKQLAYLKRNYTITTLHNVVSLIYNNIRTGSPVFALTFDDNYREFFTNVFPICSKYNVPFTVFVATDPLQKRQPLFVDTVIHAIHYTKRPTLDLTKHGLGVYSLTTQKQKTYAIQSINTRAKMVDRTQKQELVQEIYRQLKANNNSLDKALLTWNHLVLMQKAGVTIGAHTLSHPCLTFLSEQEVKTEISRSKTILEETLSTQIDFFAYPYGTEESYNDNIVKNVEKAGYIAAFTLENGKSNQTLYTIERVNISASTCTIDGKKFFSSLFALELSGLAHFCFLRFLKR